MQLDKLVAGIERFFYDIIGSLIPGSILLAGLWVIADPPHIIDDPLTAPDSSAEWWLFVAIAFVVGSGLTTFGERVIVPFTLFSTGWYRALNSKTELIPTLCLREKLAQQDTVQRLAKRFLPGVRPTSDNVGQLRNIAMSLIPADDRATVIRFMFLSLMSLGAATACILLSAYAFWAYWDTWGWLGRLLVAIGGVSVAMVFMVRRFEFYNRSQRLPFDMAVASLTNDEIAPARTLSDTENSTQPQTVYLAGGHRNPWRNGVKSAVPAFTYYDPSQHGLSEPRAYTNWDLAAIRRSDIVFAYFESSNPSGYGLAVEVGYAAAFGKHVILVDEKSAVDDSAARYLRIVRETANVYFTELDEGIHYLQQLPSVIP